MARLCVACRHRVRWLDKEYCTTCYRTEMLTMPHHEVRGMPSSERQECAAWQLSGKWLRKPIRGNHVPDQP